MVAIRPIQKDSFLKIVLKRRAQPRRELLRQPQQERFKNQKHSKSFIRLPQPGQGFYKICPALFARQREDFNYRGVP